MLEDIIALVVKLTTFCRGGFFGRVRVDNYWWMLFQIMMCMWSYIHWNIAQSNAALWSLTVGSVNSEIRYDSVSLILLQNNQDLWLKLVIFPLLSCNLLQVCSWTIMYKWRMFCDFPLPIHIVKVEYRDYGHSLNGSCKSKKISDIPCVSKRGCLSMWSFW